jgi:hypothetical protein
MTKFKLPYILAAIFLACVYFSTSLVQDPYVNLIVAVSYVGVMIFIWRDE